MKYTVRSGKHKSLVQIDRKLSPLQQSLLEIPVGKRTLRVQVLETNSDGSLRTLMVDDRIIPVQVLRRNDGFPETVILRGMPHPVEIEKVESTRYRPATKGKKISGEIKANLPGVVVSLLVQEGDVVEKGQPILVLEAMKMENEVSAQKAGKIGKVNVAAGQSVMRGDVMLEIE